MIDVFLDGADAVAKGLEEMSVELRFVASGNDFGLRRR